MNAHTLVSLKLASDILRAKGYQIIHLCETGCIKPTEDPKGRGRVRRFSRDDLFVLVVALELQNAGLTTDRIAVVTQGLSLLTRKRVAAVRKGTGICDAIAQLGNSDNPVLLHIKIPERVAGEKERPMAFIQSVRLPTTMLSENIGACSNAREIALWPIHTTMNLTFFLSTIRLR